MSLKETILQDLSESLKKQDKKRLKALRLLKGAISNKEIELRPQPLSDKEIVSVIKKQINQTKESISCYKQAKGYENQLADEEFDLSVLQAYLPEEMSEEQVKLAVKEVIQKVKPQSMKDMGAVMKAALAKTEGRADGKLLSQVVRDQLQNL